MISESLFLLLPTSEHWYNESSETSISERYERSARKKKRMECKSVKSEFKRNILIDLSGKRFHQFCFKFIYHPKTLGWSDG